MCSRPTPPATVARRAGWPSCVRASHASDMARRCETPASWPSSWRACRRERPMSDSIFIADGHGDAASFVPTEHARGPWDPNALHGGAPAALITSAFEQMQPGAELVIARLGFELLRPVPSAPLRLSTEI